MRRLGDFGRWLRASFAPKLLAGAKVKRPAPGTNAVAVLEAQPSRRIVANTLVLLEDIAHGQHVERFTVEGLAGGRWSELARATTIGQKRILRWPPQPPEGLRVTVHEARDRLHLPPPELHPRELVRAGRRALSSSDCSRRL